MMAKIATTIELTTNGIISNGFITIGRPNMSGSPILNKAAGRAINPMVLRRLDLLKHSSANSGASPVQT